MFLITISDVEVFLKCVLLPLFQVPWQGTGGNEKFFFENESVRLKMLLWNLCCDYFQ